MPTRRATSPILLLAAVACAGNGAAPNPDLPATAEAFLDAVYGCAQEHIGELANPDVSISYPVFSSIYGTSVLRGVQAVTELSGSFCRRWTDGVLSVDETIVQGDRAVLVWSFSATNRQAEDPAAARESWGGISVFRFDDDGRVLEEFGEESTPGPTARRAHPPQS